MRILIADDNRLIRSGVANILSSEPQWEVCGEASNGVEAIQKSLELRPEVVLLDVSMPGPSGFETARLLRRDNAGIKILIMSQHDAGPLLAKALEAGADGCLDKAHIATDLLAVIKSFMAT